MRHISIKILCLSFLAACLPAIDEVQKNVKPYHPPQLPATQSSDITPVPDHDFFGDRNKGLGACHYLRALHFEHKANASQPFRLFEEIVVDRNGGTVWGYQNLSKNPQLLFGLSKEFNPAGKPIDPPSIDEFVDMAKQKHKDGELSWGKVSLLRILRSVRARQTLAGLRNSAVQDVLQESMPGVVDAKSMSIEKSVVLANFFSTSKIYNNLSELSYTEKNSFKLMAFELPLFRSDDSQLRSDDLRMVLEILSRHHEEEDALLAFREEVCRFVLGQRLTAQILSDKGFAGAPVLERGGYIKAEFSKNDRWVYPETDVSGAYEGVLTEERIGELLGSGQGLRPARASDTLSYLQELRQVVSKMALLRQPQVWNAQEGSSSLLNPKLLQLQFGLFGILAPILTQEELSVLPEYRMSLADNSVSNFIELGHLALDLLWALEGIGPDYPDTDSLLDAAQQEALAGDSELSVKSRFKRLLLGLFLELNARSRSEVFDNHEVEVLSDIYMRAGRQLQNPALYDRGLALRDSL